MVTVEIYFSEPNQKIVESNIMAKGKTVQLIIHVVIHGVNRMECGGLERKRSIKGLSNVLPFVLSTPNKQWNKKRHTLLSAVDATTERDPDL